MCRQQQSQSSPPPSHYLPVFFFIILQALSSYPEVAIVHAPKLHNLYFLIFY